MAFSLKKALGGDTSEEEYIEIDLGSAEEVGNKVAVRPFVLKQYDDVNEILNSLRDGYTVAVIDIKPLKSKDVIELKRAVSKVKKTVDALEGSIAGFGDNIVIATPSFAEIHKTVQKPSEKRDFIGTGQ